MTLAPAAAVKSTKNAAEQTNSPASFGLFYYLIFHSDFPLPIIEGKGQISHYHTEINDIQRKHNIPAV